jgi:hypothetical protein
VLGWLSQGELRGERRSLIRVLRARFGPSLPDELTTAIEGMSDADELARWIDLAATVDSLQAFRAAIGR